MKSKHEAAIEAVYRGKLPRGGGFIEVPTALFADDSGESQRGPALPGIAFYSRPAAGGDPQVFRRPDQPFSSLAIAALDSILVREEDLSALKVYVEALFAGSGEASMQPQRRMEILRRSAVRVVEDLFEEPTPEKITQSTKVVSSFVHVLMKDPGSYMLLARLSSHDPYTLQHSVGTAVNCIILARKIGITDEAVLHEAGVAGLLHDVGKVRVKQEIINKNGPLDDFEWEEMRAHVSEGYELVKEHPDISERTKRAILEHHEDKDGGGYPQGLKSSEIDLVSKIVTLCDIYNALTTNRPYAKARSPFEAFQFIREKLSHKVDEELFRHLVEVYGGKVPT